VIFFYGQLFENFRGSLLFGAILSHGKSCALILAKKNCARFILGEFFTNSSGHPAGHRGCDGAICV
jgi:hypothetical protein